MPRPFPLTQDELPEAAMLEAEHFVAPWTLRQFQNGYDQGTFRILGVRIDAVLAGYISCQILSPEMEILNMAVRQNFRMHGLGRILAATALEHGAAKGVAACHLEVDETNIAALHLYTALGFAVSGRRRGYYQHPEGARDAILMRCNPLSRHHQHQH